MMLRTLCYLALLASSFLACQGTNAPTAFADPPLRGHMAFTVAPSSAGLFVGDSVRVRAVPTAGFWLWRDTTVIWTSRQPRVAEVDSVTGLVQAVAAGSTTIVATLKTDIRYTASAHLDVVP